jgi:hypothetical protein
MKIKFFNPDTLDKNLKATVHKTGKLGFTTEAAKKLELSPEKSASIGMNEDDENDKNLYLVINPIRTSGAFNVSKAGEYFYINTKALFDSLKIDYTKDSVVYEINEEKEGLTKYYKLKRKESAKKIAQ